MRWFDFVIRNPELWIDGRDFVCVNNFHSSCKFLLHELLLFKSFPLIYIFPLTQKKSISIQIHKSTHCVHIVIHNRNEIVGIKVKNTCCKYEYLLNIFKIHNFLSKDWRATRRRSVHIWRNGSWRSSVDGRTRETYGSKITIIQTHGKFIIYNRWIDKYSEWCIRVYITPM